jgi:hypothetical protein
MQFYQKMNYIIRVNEDKEFKMKNTNLTRGLNVIAVAFFLLLSPFAGAYAACCAGHGGVASCNKAIGYKMCKDGTASPTCTCAKAKATKATTTKAIKATTTNKAATIQTNKAATTTTNKATTTNTNKATTTKPNNSWWGGKSTTTTPVSSSTTSAKGCCSRHGGVAQCNKVKGHLTCKDGTLSASCTCL